MITELDGKKRADFDFLDQFIADYAIRIDRAEEAMKIPSLEIARKIVDIQTPRKEILTIVSGITPAKIGRGHQSPKCGGNDDGYAEKCVPERCREIRHILQT